MASIDLAAKRLGKPVSLGYKDHSKAGNGFDASDKNTAIDIKTWPVLGMYQPDGIAAFQAGGVTYYVTANEGDAREYTGFTEHGRIKDQILSPDYYTVTEVAEYKDETTLGRLNITLYNDMDGDVFTDTFFSFGARSFSVLKAGQIIYDSGDKLEQFFSTNYPDYFNVSNNNNTKKNRSDDKGPEPESVVTGKIGDSTYIFVGLERQSGIMVYAYANNATEAQIMAGPRFVAYLNNRDYTKDTEKDSLSGDLGPEGLTFVSKDNSPTGSSLLIVGNEISGSVTVWNLTDVVAGIGSKAAPLAKLTFDAQAQELRTDAVETLRVFDLEGREVLQGRSSVSTRGLVPGVYVAQAEGAVLRFMVR